MAIAFFGKTGGIYTSADNGLTWTLSSAVTDLHPANAHQPDQPVWLNQIPAPFAHKAIFAGGSAYYPVCTAHDAPAGIRVFQSLAGVDTSDYYAYLVIPPYDLPTQGESFFAGWDTDGTNIYLLGLYYPDRMCLQIPIANPATMVEIGNRTFGGYLMQGIVCWEGKIWTAAYVHHAFSGLRWMVAGDSAWTNESAGWTSHPNPIGLIGGDPAQLWFLALDADSTPRLLTRNIAGTWTDRGVAGSATDRVVLIWAGSGGRVLIQRFSYAVSPRPRTWWWTADYGATWTAVGTSSVDVTQGGVIYGPEVDGLVLIGEMLYDDDGNAATALYHLNTATGTVTDITGTFAPPVEPVSEGIAWLGEYTQTAAPSDPPLRLFNGTP